MKQLTEKDKTWLATFAGWSSLGNKLIDFLDCCNKEKNLLKVKFGKIADEMEEIRIHREVKK